MGGQYLVNVVVTNRAYFCLCTALCTVCLKFQHCYLIFVFLLSLYKNTKCTVILNKNLLKNCLFFTFTFFPILSIFHSFLGMSVVYKPGRPCFRLQTPKEDGLHWQKQSIFIVNNSELNVKTVLLKFSVV